MTKISLSATVSLVILCVALAACGIERPLKHPEDDKGKVVAPQPPVPAIVPSNPPADDTQPQ